MLRVQLFNFNKKIEIKLKKFIKDKYSLIQNGKKYSRRFWS